MGRYGKTQYGNYRVTHKPTGRYMYVLESSIEFAKSRAMGYMDMDYLEDKNMAAELTEKLPSYVYVNGKKHSVDTQEQSDVVTKLMRDVGVDELLVYDENNQLTGELFTQD